MRTVKSRSKSLKRRSRLQRGGGEKIYTANKETKDKRIGLSFAYESDANKIFINKVTGELAEKGLTVGMKLINLKINGLDISLLPNNSFQ